MPAADSSPATMREPGPVRVNSDGQLIKIPPAEVGLSTSSVYPETTSSAFELARRLGYDGVELMVGIDPVAADIDAVEKLRDYHGVPVLAVHSPCLLITQRVWGTDPWAKLERSAEAALRLDADVVVVHPPFRWQRDYAQRLRRGRPAARARDRRHASASRTCIRGVRRAESSRRTCPAGIRASSSTRPDAGFLARLDCQPAVDRSGQVLGIAAAARPPDRRHRSAKDEHLVPGPRRPAAGGCCSTSRRTTSPATSCSRSTRARAAPGPAGSRPGRVAGLRPATPRRTRARPRTPWTPPGSPARSEARARSDLRRRFPCLDGSGVFRTGFSELFPSRDDSHTRGRAGSERIT